MKIRLLVVIAVSIIFSAGQMCGAVSLEDRARSLAAEADGRQVVAGTDGWLFLKDELAHIGAAAFWGEAAAGATRSTRKEYGDPFPALVEFNRALAEKGITLYLMVVPPKALVYAEKLDPAITDVHEEVRVYEEFYSRLQQQNVKIIDLLPQLREAAKDDSGLYCRTDTHYSGDGLLMFAERAAEVIKKETWFNGHAGKELLRTEQTVSISGDLARMAGETDLREELRLHVVVDKETQKPVESDPASPVILLGDSHTLVFSAGGDLHARGAGLFDNLSEKLGFAVDLLGVRGSGAAPARIKLYQRSKQDADYLNGKKVLIYSFAARELTGGGWRLIPVAP